MFEVEVPLLARREVARGLWVLGFAAPTIDAASQPGQFVNVGLRPGPLLRRPFSIYSTDPLEIILKAVGVGTDQLLALRPGDGVSLLGPLGTGFDLASGSGPLALLSGGLGVAPMPLAARAARALGREVLWFHGARTAADLCRESPLGAAVFATDDGSEGVRGSIVEAVPESDVLEVFACGPNPMLRAVAGRWPRAQVALETYMGCGTGVCLGCAVPLRGGGYDRACREGPVYRAEAVDWDALPGNLHYAVAR